MSVLSSSSAYSNYGRGWLFLSVSLLVHVIDEAANDFLSFYNPVVEALRERVSWVPIPTFTFSVWITGLSLVVLILLLLSRLAFANSRPMRPLAYVFAALMLANGVGHIASSVYLDRPVPGVLSSPLLIVAATYLLLSLRQKAGAGMNPP